MSIFDLVVPVILALSGVQQLAGVIWFVLALSRTHRRQQTTVNDDELPLALVVLKLRGADPYLRDCLRGLIQQGPSALPSTHYRRQQGRRGLARRPRSAGPIAGGPVTGGPHRSAIADRSG